ncbi:MAG: phenylalanine--tRNA ligase beta subunit-related protein [Candidatus Aenigmatarchaeota archaeon]
MKFVVSEKVFEKYPDTKIGAIVATNIENKGVGEEILKLLEDVQSSTKEKFEINTLIENSSIAVWRNVYNSFGSKPRDYRSSVEALIRSVLNGRGVRHINKLVDIYNYISLKHVIPVGGEDIDKIEGNLHLKFSEGNESFIPLGSDKEDNPYKGEVIYCDDNKNTLCRRWNWRESDKTKMTESTKNAIIVIEGFNSNVELALKELSDLIKKFCNARTEVFLIEETNSIAEW